MASELLLESAAPGTEWSQCAGLTDRSAGVDLHHTFVMSVTRQVTAGKGDGARSVAEHQRRRRALPRARECRASS
jgi:hypothetical protein